MAVAAVTSSSPPLVKSAFGGSESQIALHSLDDSDALDVRLTTFQVSPGYFATAGIGLVRGRLFADGDVEGHVARIARGVLMRAGVYLASGLAVGLLTGALLSGLFASLLFEVRVTDPSTYAVVAALILAAGLSAAGLPAIRAARVNPIVMLRRD